MFEFKHEVSMSGLTADLHVWREGCRTVHLSVVTADELVQLEKACEELRGAMVARQKTVADYKAAGRRGTLKA